MDSHPGQRIPMGRSAILRVGASLPTSLHSCSLGTRPGIPLRCHMEGSRADWLLLFTSMHREGSVQSAGGGIILGPMPSRKGYSDEYQKWTGCSTLAKKFGSALVVVPPNVFLRTSFFFFLSLEYSCFTILFVSGVHRATLKTRVSIFL